MRLHVRPVLRWLPDAVILLCLAAAAWWAVRAYVVSGLYIWGDHPGQFMRFWYPTAVSVPKYGRVVDWNPLWYAGYPELQFYPPGHALLGLALDALTFGLLSPERVYNLIPAIALALPAFTTYVFLRVTLAPAGRLPGQVAGVVAALLASSFTPMWGGLYAVQIGLMGERLAFGVFPLAVLAGWKLIERPNEGRLVLAASLLAALILLHPFHSPAAVIAVGAYALFRRLLLRPPTPVAESEKRARWPWLVGWLLLTAGLVAWWLVPLVVRQRPFAAPLVRVTLAQALEWLKAEPAVPNLALAALPALAFLASRRWQVQAGVSALVTVIVSLALLIVFDHTILIDRLHITLLDPIRFIAEYYMVFILLAGAGAGAVVWLLRRRTWLPSIGLAALVIVALIPVAPTAWHDVQVHASVPAINTKDGLFRHPAFAGLWETLRDDPLADGRVLFTSYYLRVHWPDGQTTPTAIKSMTPYLTGREIVGGTFSHWSPGARLLWVGDPWARLLPAQVEAEDDQSMFGIRWDQMDSATLLAALRALNVTTIVADADDTNARAALDAAPHVERFWDNGYFVLYHVLVAPLAWVEASDASVRLVERSERRWRVQVDEAQAGAVLTAKMAYYPLWRAEVDGQRLPVSPDRYGMQQIELPAGGPYVVTLSYREGLLEWAGLLITLGAVGLLVLWWIAARFARR